MAKPTAKHYKLMRDNARPVEFDGAEVAAAELRQDIGAKRTTAVVYRTVGGKLISEYTKSNYCREPTEEHGSWEVERAKVASFDTLEEAAEWFRPGPITTMLLAKLQDQLKSEHIE